MNCLRSAPRQWISADLYDVLLTFNLLRPRRGTAAGRRRRRQHSDRAAYQTQTIIECYSQPYTNCFI